MVSLICSTCFSVIFALLLVVWMHKSSRSSFLFSHNVWPHWCWLVQVTTGKNPRTSSHLKHLKLTIKDVLSNKFICLMLYFNNGGVILIRGWIIFNTPARNYKCKKFVVVKSSIYVRVYIYIYTRAELFLQSLISNWDWYITHS